MLLPSSGNLKQEDAMRHPEFDHNETLTDFTPHKALLPLPEAPSQTQ